MASRRGRQRPRQPERRRRYDRRLGYGDDACFGGVTLGTSTSFGLCLATGTQPVRGASEGRPAHVGAERRAACPVSLVPTSLYALDGHVALRLNQPGEVIRVRRQDHRG
jgi:hypothetical protein